jgi:hypothetical protein
MRVLALSLALGILVWATACGRPDPVAENATAPNLPVPANADDPDPLGGPPANASTSAPNQAAPAESGEPVARIPVSLQGRWGLTPTDCTSTRGDAKGLLVIGPNELRFYESRARPSPGAQADQDSITGNFRFTGEGQSWTKFETIERDRQRLVRTESNPAASYTYAKC